MKMIIPSQGCFTIVRMIVLIIACAAFTLSLPVQAAEVPTPVTRVMPDYPVDAVTMRLEGMVRARLKIDGTGTVQTIEMTEETPLDQGFGAAAEAALRQWTFKPGVPGTFVVTLRFEPPGEDGISIDRLAAAPTPVKRVSPRYPGAAENLGKNGNAMVIVTIDTSGKVTEAAVASEVPGRLGFGQAALDAVKKWEFAPGTPGSYYVVVRFRIEGMSEAINWYDLEKAPEPTTRIEPIAPPEAISRDRSGSVKLGVQIGFGGRVTGIIIVDEFPSDFGFGPAAQAAVEQWRFEGAKEGLYRLTLRISPP